MLYFTDFHCRCLKPSAHAVHEIHSNLMSQSEWGAMLSMSCGNRHGLRTLFTFYLPFLHPRIFPSSKLLSEDHCQWQTTQSESIPLDTNISRFECLLIILHWFHSLTCFKVDLYHI